MTEAEAPAADPEPVAPKARVTTRREARGLQFLSPGTVRVPCAALGSAVDGDLDRFELADDTPQPQVILFGRFELALFRWRGADDSSAGRAELYLCSAADASVAYGRALPDAPELGAALRATSRWILTSFSAEGWEASGLAPADPESAVEGHSSALTLRTGGGDPIMLRALPEREVAGVCLAIQIAKTKSQLAFGMPVSAATAEALLRAAAETRHGGVQ
jgi:hypothetical protein